MEQEPNPNQLPPSMDGPDSAKSIMERFNKQFPEAGQEPQQQQATPPPPPEDKPVEQAPPQVQEQEPQSAMERQQEADAPKGAEKVPYKWGELKKELATTRDALTQREREMAELRAKNEELSKVDVAAYQRDLEDYRKRVEEYEREMAVHDITKTQAYREEVAAPVKKIEGELKMIADSYGIDPQKIYDAVYQLDPKARRDAMREVAADMDQVDIIQIQQLGREASTLQQRALQMQEHAYETLREIEYMKQQEAEQKKREREKLHETARAKASEQVFSQLPWLNEKPEYREKLLKAELAGDDPMKQTFHAMAFAASSIMEAELAAARAEAAKYKNELEQRNKVGVRVGAHQTNSASPTQNGPKPVEGSNAWERWKAFSGQAR